MIKKNVILILNVPTFKQYLIRFNSVAFNVGIYCGYNLQY